MTTGASDARPLSNSAFEMIEERTNRAGGVLLRLSVTAGASDAPQEKPSAGRKQGRNVRKMRGYLVALQRRIYHGARVG